MSVFDGYLEEVFLYLFLVILPLIFQDAFLYVYCIYLFLVLSLIFQEAFFFFNFFTAPQRSQRYSIFEIGLERRAKFIFSFLYFFCKLEICRRLLAFAPSL